LDARPEPLAKIEVRGEIGQTGVAPGQTRIGRRKSVG
jgi:hypothetical protein